MRELTRKRGPWQIQATVNERGPRPLVLIVEPTGVLMRPKGLRTGYRLPWQTIYVMAARAEALAKLKARELARLERRKARRAAR